MEEVKKDCSSIAENIREGQRNRVPMGILFTGPMGTGKTFVAEAFAKECGLTTIKLKNFRSQVGRRDRGQPRDDPDGRFRPSGRSSSSSTRAIAPSAAATATATAAPSRASSRASRSS